MKSSALQVVFYLWGKCLTSNIFFTNLIKTQKNLVFACVLMVCSYTGKCKRKAEIGSSSPSFKLTVIYTILTKWAKFKISKNF